MGEVRELLAQENAIADVAIEEPAHGVHRPVQRLEIVPGIEPHAMPEQGDEHRPGGVGIRRPAIACGIVSYEGADGEGASSCASVGGTRGGVARVGGVRRRNKKRFTRL